MPINREEIHKIVELFYQPVSKTFFVNSVNEKDFIKPIGVFVSLGITTSMKVLEDIKSVLSEYNYDVVIAEISSKKIGSMYMNTVITVNPQQQYKLVEFDEGVMNKEQAEHELSELEKKMDVQESLDLLKENAPKIIKLRGLIKTLTDTNGWNAHLIQKENDDYKIYHQYVNYKKDGDVEYRIGLYVTEKN